MHVSLYRVAGTDMYRVLYPVINISYRILQTTFIVRVST